MYNKYILEKLIRIKLLKPKIYIVTSNKSLNDIKKIVNVYNSLVKSINKALNLPSRLSIDGIVLKDLIWDNSKIIIKNYPYVYYEIGITNNFISSEKNYIYTDGVDCLIFKKTLKKSIISVYIQHASFKGNKKTSGFNIWDILPKIDYYLYCNINNCISMIDNISIRCLIISKDTNISMEELYISIMNGKSMHDELDIKIIYYDINKQRHFNHFNNFKVLPEYDKKNDIANVILTYKNKKLFLYIKKLYNSKIQNTVLNKNNLTYDLIVEDKIIPLKKTYFLHYYKINKDIFYYNDNNNNIKIFSNEINFDGLIDIDHYEFNYKLYNKNSLFIKLCIASQIIDKYENEILNINDENIETVIKNIKKINNKILINNLSKLLNKSIKDHMNEINININDIKYDYNLQTFVGKNSDIYNSIYKLIKEIYLLSNA
ncbi:hypothetical protein MseVgp157 [Melanoplus sanguinipes entomopoxvirus]|uniref:Uncharacterized protein n=1 Tax=Melanoplus sanguinipes entomopoxvirus TaxID=83191 RepID=Q9YVT5_MSEPV|nr:hypothetical protein MseVgp157 [Melanoplus sanguinipes entomopoxvirus]AAC97678.1 ORF MSV157 hypothetical protein [Melanoplus sanguinipes entomopoxvirus 'O']